MRKQLYFYRNMLIFFIAIFTLSYSVIGDAARQNSQQINWHRYSEQAFKKAAYEKRLILLYGYVSWCHFCKRMQSTFQDPSVVQLINSRYIPVKVNLEQESTIANQYDISTFPTIIILDGKHNVVDKFSGYMPANSLVAKLQAVSG